MDAEVERKMKKEHWEKYEALAQRIGIQELRAQVLQFFTREAIDHALARGDEHLNTLMLTQWDRAAGDSRPDNILGRGPKCSHCGQRMPGRPDAVLGPPYSLTFDGVWGRVKPMGLSLADRVCILKHVARYYI